MLGETAVEAFTLTVRPTGIQRSIRLSRQWRAIYEVRTDGGIQLITIEEVTPHVY
jgi:hypothetical protein